MYWTYTALNRQGEEITINLSGTKKDILQQISQQQWHLIEIKPDYRRLMVDLFYKKKLSVLSCAVFFEDFHNMLETGMSIGQIILIFKETTKDELLSMKFIQVEEQLHQGQSLTDSFVDACLFPWIVNVTISAGEKTGRLSESFKTLGQYFRKSYEVRVKIKQALIYPGIVFTSLLAVMFFISFKVIPQLKSFLPQESLDNQNTQGLLLLSLFLQQYAFVLLAIVFLIVLGVYVWSKNDRYQFQEWLYRWPVVGVIFKESALALYLLNLSVLLKSGVTILNAIRELNYFDASPVAAHFMKSREYMLGGVSFWQSIEQDKFFPKIIAATLHRAEEMVKVDEYALNLSEYFYKRSNALVDALIQIVQPVLLAFGGLFLVIIAFAFLLPIYGNLTNIAGSTH